MRRDRDVSPPRLQQLRDRMYKNKEIMGEVHFLTRAFRVSEGFMMQMTVIGVSRSHSCERGFTRLRRARVAKKRKTQRKSVASLAAPLSFRSGAQSGLAKSAQPQRLVHASAHSGKCNTSTAPQASHLYPNPCFCKLLSSAVALIQ